MILAADRQDKIDAIVARFTAGEFTETVFAVSLGIYLPPDEVRYILLTTKPPQRKFRQ